LEYCLEDRDELVWVDIGDLLQHTFSSHVDPASELVGGLLS